MKLYASLMSSGANEWASEQGNVRRGTRKRSHGGGKRMSKSTTKQKNKQCKRNGWLSKWGLQCLTRNFSMLSIQCALACARACRIHDKWRNPVTPWPTFSFFPPFLLSSFLPFSIFFSAPEEMLLRYGRDSLRYDGAPSRVLDLVRGSCEGK